MSELTIEPTSLHLASEDHRDQARTEVARPTASEAAVLPFLLVAVALFAAGVLSATHFRSQSDRVMLFAAFGAAGMPMLYWPPAFCHAPAENASAIRLERADLLALLEKK
jgi:hypothetical protein